MNSFLNILNEDSIKCSKLGDKNLRIEKELITAEVYTDENELIHRLNKKVSLDLHDIKHYITHYEVTTCRELLDIETEPFTNYLTMKYDSMKSVTKKKIKKINGIPNRILDQNYKLYRTDSSTRFTVLMDLCTCSS